MGTCPQARTRRRMAPHCAGRCRLRQRARRRRSCMRCDRGRAPTAPRPASAPAPTRKRPPRPSVPHPPRRGQSRAASRCARAACLPTSFELERFTGRIGTENDRGCVPVLTLSRSGKKTRSLIALLCGGKPLLVVSPVGHLHVE